MGRQKCIVVADDEPYIANLLADVLENQGYRVRVAHDGEAALAAAREERPDLLLSDVMMPRRNGLEVVKAMRAQPDLHDVPVVLTSAGRKPDIRWPGVEFLPKPFDLGQVIDLAAQEAGQPKAGRSTARS